MSKRKTLLDLNDFSVALKQDLPCLRYDISLYCKNLLDILPASIPDYLSYYSNQVISYAQQTKKCKPKEFPCAYRVYLVDYRLNVLFAALDPTGKIATCFSKYGKKAHKMEDYYYGDGEMIGSALPVIGYTDSIELSNFKETYGFLPVEELAQPVALVFDGSEFVDGRGLSQFQLCLLMERFHSKNLVDWKSIIRTQKWYYDV